MGPFWNYPRPTWCKPYAFVSVAMHSGSLSNNGFRRSVFIVERRDISKKPHYNDVIKSAMASQTTSLTIIYSSVYSGADQRNHWGLVSLAFVRRIHRWPVNSPHKGPVTRKMPSFDDVIMLSKCVNDMGLDKHRPQYMYAPQCNLVFLLSHTGCWPTTNNNQTPYCRGA